MNLRISTSFFLFLFIFCHFSNSLYSQQDTIKQQLQEVEISASSPNAATTSTTPLQQINAQQMATLPILQLSDALKYFSGVVIKDYGGVGGLKTVSVRGFGAQHTAIVYEGIALSDIQTGQIDLSRIPTENIENISLFNGQSDDIFVPARQLASASLILIESSKPKFKDDERQKIDFSFTGGSYHLYNPFLNFTQLIKKKKKENDSEIIAFVRGNYLQSRGNYPYTLHFGNQGDSTVRQKRANSDIHSFLIEGELITTFRDNSLLTSLFSYYDSERGLPGATILYNKNSHERLWNKNLLGNISFQKDFYNNLSYKSLAKIDYAYTRYEDPDFLNSQHYLKNIYIQREFYLTNIIKYKFQPFSFSLSNDLIYNNLSSNAINFIFPNRWSILTALSGEFGIKHLKIRSNLLHSLFLDKTSINRTKPQHHFSPTVSLSYQPLLQKELHFRFFYKNIFRMPTFYDLYYRDVGNLALNPEKTDQLNVGMTYLHHFLSSRLQFSFTGDYFYNQIRDKIVAIPNKNLFIWTMLNFGKVRSNGVDITTSFMWKVTTNFDIHLDGSYALNHSIDVTNKLSKSYLHQIPYTPVHSGAVSLSLFLYRFSISGNLVLAGERYILAQNILQNRLEPYFDGSASCGYTFLTSNYSLSLKFEVLNITDSEYEIIKNYPMPGRSFRIKVELHF